MSWQGSLQADPMDRRPRPVGDRTRWHYRIFFVLPDRMEGRCELRQDAPISPDHVDQIEQALMERLGSGNALVIGWQQLRPSHAAART